MTHTNFGSESVMDLRLVKIGEDDVWQRKIVNEKGVIVWIDVEKTKTGIDDVKTEAVKIDSEFYPHTDIVKKEKTDNFASETLFKPQEISGVKTDVLIRKSIDDARKSFYYCDRKLMEDYMDRLIRLHAVLIRITGVTPETILKGHETNIDKLSKNSALREAVLLLIDIVGEPWTSVKDKI